MKHRESRNLRRARGFNFRHKNRPAGIASQMEVILLAPLRRLGTLQLDGVNGARSRGEGSNRIRWAVVDRDWRFEGKASFGHEFEFRFRVSPFPHPQLSPSN